MIERLQHFMMANARLWIPAALLVALAMTLPMHVEIMQAHVDDLSFFASICTFPTFK